MTLEGAGGNELAQLVADHILGHVNGHVLLAVMNGESVANERGEDGGGTAPGLQNLLLVVLIHLIDPLQQLGSAKGALLNASAHLLHCLLT